MGRSIVAATTVYLQGGDHHFVGIRGTHHRNQDSTSPDAKNNAQRIWNSAQVVE